MRVLQVIPELETGGAERTTIDIANALVAAGLTAFVASQGGKMVAELDPRARHIALPVKSKNPLRMVANARSLEGIIKDEGIDIIHARSRAPAWSSLLAARRTRTPLVTTYHGAYKASSKLKSLYNSVMARGDAVIANSGFTRTSIVEQFPFAAERLKVIHRGTDMADFDGNAEPYEWGLPDGVTPVVQIARLTEWKGQRVSISALKSLPDDVHLILCGDDQGRANYTAALKELANDIGVSDRVHIVGHVEPARALASADLCLVASTEPEAFGRSAVEAQAAQVPVVVSDHGAVAETVLAPPETSDALRTGWRVPSGDPGALAKALEDVLALAPDAMDAHLKRAREHVERNFSLNSMCEATLEVYASLIE